MRDELETGTDCYLDPKFFFRLYQHFFLILAAQPWVNEGFGPSLTHGRWLSIAAGSQFVILSPTDSDRLCAWLYYVLRPPASAVLPLIYTGASLDWRLGRGSICYITINLCADIKEVISPNQKYHPLSKTPL